ncbi:family 16 glycosylhydrolase [Mucilaginibacter sp. AK015]|uniref:glycoside hydrolase family 16 protein n=1 Tax=Mucilaginibacter sp. AK015 TaxID=2723072 RepID=UPI00161F0208|nr:glycoside hydrolase family 16 protein [Mucilaginibacter sp. AK015]MBB5395525.1 beta-glucanase (GH16 family) [Mucilaginibacter sp. AK015]
MQARLIGLLALLAASTAVVAQPSKRDTVFFDDFKEGTLDRSKWNVEVTGHTVNDEQQAYVDSAATIYIENGTLVLRALYKPGYTSKQGNKYDFISGRINTSNKVMFTYGSASARMKVAGGEGMWPAFWALGKGKWPDCGEIDVMETVGDTTWTSNALHGPGYFGNTPLVYRAHFSKGTDATQWHVYSVDWTENSLTFKVDGLVTYKVTKAMAEKYGRWAFDNPKFLILNFAVGGGYPNSVNKVSKPYYGLSQASVDKIKAGNARVYVDWVLVTK